MIDESTRQLVRRRAVNRCEYCHLPQSVHDEQFSIDHVRARQHHGDDSAENLALSCLRCNLHKGPNLSGVDPATDSVVQLFDPRRQSWPDHFRWNGAVIVGVTSEGRATVDVLGMNAIERVRVREALLAEGIRLD